MSNKKQISFKPDSQGGITSASKVIRGRLTDVENLTKAVLFVGVISLVGIVVAVCAMVIDQMHFNNQTYQNNTDKLNLEIQELHTEINTLKNPK